MHIRFLNRKKIIMTKELKDFIHLYLGCGLMFINTENPDHTFPLVAVTNISYELSDDDAGIEVVLFSDEDESNIKPILRPLSDMTEEEGKVIDDMATEQRDNWQKIPNCNFFTGVRTKSAEALLYLLSKHFDLFGLIDDGLAIDKTKLNFKKHFVREDGNIE